MFLGIEPEIPKELPEKTVPKEVEITPAAEKLSTPTVQGLCLRLYCCFICHDNLLLAKPLPATYINNDDPDFDIRNSATTRNTLAKVAKFRTIFKIFKI